MRGSTMRNVVVACGLLGSNAAQAGTIGGSHAFGLGIALGSPTAITGKVYLGGDYNALEFQIGEGDYVGGYGDNIYAHLVYLWHPSVLTTANNLEIPWHIGVGGAIWEGGYCAWYNDGGCFGGDLAFAVRVPVGLDFNLDDPRFQFFVDVVPMVVVVPGIDIGIGAQIGARYYF